MRSRCRCCCRRQNEPSNSNNKTSVCVGEKELTKNVTVRAKLTLPSSSFKRDSGGRSPLPPRSLKILLAPGRAYFSDLYLYFCFRLNLLWTHKSNIYISKLTSSTRGRNSIVFLLGIFNLRCKLNRQLLAWITVVCAFVSVCEFL